MFGQAKSVISMEDVATSIGREMSISAVYPVLPLVTRGFPAAGAIWTFASPT